MHQHILDLPAALSQQNMAYLPSPNTVDVVLTDLEAPADITRSAFVLPFLETGELALATIKARGVEIPGGHIEAGESIIQAAERECLEETGCTLLSLVPIGFLRLHSTGEAPEAWRYPHPLGCQQFYAGLIRDMQPFTTNAECGEPALVAPDDAAKMLRPADMPFYHKARELLFGTSYIPNPQ